MPEHTFIWNDLQYTAVLFASDDGIGFEVYRQHDYHRNTKIPLYESVQNINKKTKYLEDARMFSNGSITVEGCINFQIGEAGYMGHLCSPGELMNMNSMLMRLYRCAQVLLSEKDSKETSS